MTLLTVINAIVILEDIKLLREADIKKAKKIEIEKKEKDEKDIKKITMNYIKTGKKETRINDEDIHV